MKVEKDTLDTAHLRLTTRVMKEWAQTETGQRYRYEHTVLGITNKSDKYLAYRVETAVDHPEKCMSKGALAQNAVALAPGESLERTECLWRPHATVTVKRVEVMELPQIISYYFVSRLVPSQVLLDERTAAGHEFAKAKPCQFVPWREIQTAAKGARHPLGRRHRLLRAPRLRRVQLLARLCALASAGQAAGAAAQPGRCAGEKVVSRLQ